MSMTIPSPPRQIGRYEILGEVGRGAMGVVYKARDPLIDRLVALKTIAVEGSGAETETFRQRFFREARSAGGLSHPNIVTIHDVGESDEVAYIAMEFLSGQSLREILDSGTVLPVTRIADIAAQVADGLAFAHKKNIVHRDIKPANIMVTDTGIVKITDFGIALLPTGTRTVAGTVFGSPKYISPERLRGNHVDGRSDIFSLGAVLYEMLTGLPPFNGADLNALLYQILSVMPVAPSSKNRKIAPAFDLIVATALAKNPGDRYRDARDMAMDLRHCAEPGALTAFSADAPAAETTEPPVRWREGDPTMRLERPAPMSLTGTIPMLEDPSPEPINPIPPQWRRAALFAVPVVLLALGVAAVLATREGNAPASAAVQTARPVAASPVTATPGGPAPVASAPVATAPGTTTPVVTAPVVKPPVVTAPILTRATAVTMAPGIAQRPADAPSGTAPLPRSLEPIAPVSAPAPPATPTPIAAGSGTSGGGVSVLRPALLGIAVVPWGEVYVNGKMVGVTPPLTELKLAPGQYTVELRNATFPGYRKTIELREGMNVKIRHKFQ